MYNAGSPNVTGFHRLDGTLACDGVPLPAIAASVGTPLYIYSAATIASRYHAVDAAFAAHPHAIHYALKANSTLAIARLLRGLGSNADANSGGEIEVALRAGFTPPQIVFTGVGKTITELEQAIALGVSTINAESDGELDRIDAIGRARGTRVRVALRVNPDIDARSHQHISTGLKTTKFGIALDEVRSIARKAAAHSGLELVGLHSHVGSQITDLTPLTSAAEALVRLSRELRDDGITIEHLDSGGGLGISYDGTPAPTASDYAAALLPAVKDSGLSIILEPGRSIVGPAAVLVSSVVDVKERPGGMLFVILDARDDRADAADALQRVPPYRTGGRVRAAGCRRRRRRPALRDERHPGPRLSIPAADGRRTVRGPRRRRIRSSHGLELQPADDAAGSNGRGRPSYRHPATADDRRSDRPRSLTSRGTG